MDSRSSKSKCPQCRSVMMAVTSHNMVTNKDTLMFLCIHCYNLAREIGFKNSPPKSE